MRIFPTTTIISRQFFDNPKFKGGHATEHGALHLFILHTFTSQNYRSPLFAFWLYSIIFYNFVSRAHPNVLEAWRLQWTYFHQTCDKSSSFDPSRSPLTRGCTVAVPLLFSRKMAGAYVQNGRNEMNKMNNYKPPCCELKKNKTRRKQEVAIPTVCALILSETLALYKSFTYLLTYLQTADNFRQRR